VGVNEMVSIAAEHLHKAGYRRFVFANRTPEHAAQLAKAYGVEAHALADLGRLLDAADVTLACTGAATPLITCALLNGERAGGTPRLLIDLGVPRDIEPEAGALPGVTLLDLDDLKSKLSVNLDRRMNAIASAEEIIERKLAEFSYWYEAVRLEPIYNGLADAFESIRREELTTVDGDCPPEWRKALDRFSVRLARRLLQAASRPRGE
jgi:glutamyl-tRNA reductase